MLVHLIGLDHDYQSFLTPEYQATLTEPDANLPYKATLSGILQSTLASGHVKAAFEEAGSTNSIPRRIERGWYSETVLQAAVRETSAGRHAWLPDLSEEDAKAIGLPSVHDRELTSEQRQLKADHRELRWAAELDRCASELGDDAEVVVVVGSDHLNDLRAKLVARHRVVSCRDTRDEVGFVARELT